MFLFGAHSVELFRCREAFPEHSGTTVTTILLDVRLVQVSTVYTYNSYGDVLCSMNRETGQMRLQNLRQRDSISYVLYVRYEGTVN